MLVHKLAQGERVHIDGVGWIILREIRRDGAVLAIDVPVEYDVTFHSPAPPRQSNKSAVVFTDAGYLATKTHSQLHQRFTDNKDEAVRMSPGEAAWYASRPEIEKFHGRVVMLEGK